MARLTISLLGPFQATLDGQPISSFESDKVRALLAYLAVEYGRPHPREKLAGLLWPERPESAARNNLTHALAVLRQAIGDRDTGVPALLVSRQAIQLNPAGDTAVDVRSFAESSGVRDLTGLEQAMALYRGRLLEGFSLPGCPEFEEWLLLEQEHLHRRAMEALARLTAGYEALGELERALTFAWRQLELDPWWESAHQQAMRLLARSGQRDAALAQYQTCCRLLAEELGVEPSAETVALYEQIRHGQLPAEPDRRQENVPPTAALPGFLTGRAAPAQRPVFVARDHELARLEGHLAAALSGRGQVAFVVGGPGRGKTALLGEFARRALDAHPGLLLAMGAGSAYAGVGDPYLPFREALAMLSGEVEGRWAAGTITTEQARRLWEALPEVGAALAEWGSGLVGTLLPGQELVCRARAAAPSGGGWLDRLERLVARGAPSQTLEQSHLFEQYANVLLDLSVKHPLLIVLDDLQWADLASISLLFHMGRRVDRGRILLAGAYRPHEVALGRDGQRHPLEPVLAELRARFGDVWVDLAALGEEEGRRFVDQLVDTEPNQLADGFRGALFRRTGGHALFTIELLRDMQERGSLQRDEERRWIEAEALDWEALPARAEAVIAERIARLPEELRQVLAAGSVEGEEFTAQAVAQVQGLDDLQALRMLGRELAGRHRLVRELGEAQVDGRSLSRYRFSHFLVQQHLYQGLGEGERRLLHRRVGEALEQLYAGHLTEIAVQLAHHFAGDAGRECRYAGLAGERAAAQYANEEAVRYLSRALELTPGRECNARYELLLAREKVLDRLGQLDAQQHDLVDLERLAEELGAEQQAAVAARRAGYAYRVCDFPAAAAAAQVAVQRAQAAGHVGLQAGGHRFWGWALFRQGDVPTAWSHYNQALALAQAGGLRALEADALSSLGDACSDLAEGQRYCAQGLRIAREDGDRTLEGYVLHRLSNISRQLGDLGASWTGFEQCLGLARAIGDPRLESYVLANMGLGCCQLGDYPRARVYFEQARRICEEGEDHYLAALLLAFLADVARSEGEHEEAWTYAQRALRVSREVGAPEAERGSLCRLGSLYRDLSDHTASQDCYRQALRCSRPYGQSWGMEPLAGLACSCLAQGALGQAQANVAEILAYLDAGGSLNADCKPFWTYLVCYQVLVVAGDPRAPEILARAHAQLQEWAARIPDDAQRRSFLENVPENRELARLWKEAQARAAGSQ